MECARCGRSDIALKSCAKCRMASYCGRDCQVADWKAGHREECKAALRADPSASDDGDAVWGSLPSDATTEELRQLLKSAWEARHGSRTKENAYLHLLTVLIEAEAEAQRRGGKASPDLGRLVRLAWTDRVWRGPLPSSMALATVQEIWASRTCCLINLDSLLSHRELLLLFELKKEEIEQELAKGDRQRIAALSPYLTSWLCLACVVFDEEHSDKNGRICPRCGESEVCYEKFLRLWDQQVTSMVLMGEECSVMMEENKVVDLVATLLRHRLGDAAVRHLSVLRDLWPRPQHGNLSTKVCLLLAEALLLEQRLDELEVLTTELQARGDVQGFDLVRLTYVQAELSWWWDKPQSALDHAKRGVDLLMANRMEQGKPWDVLHDIREKTVEGLKLFLSLRRLEADALEDLDRLEEAVRVDEELWQTFWSSIPSECERKGRLVISPEAAARLVLGYKHQDRFTLEQVAVQLAQERRRICAGHVTPARHARYSTLEMERECRPLQLFIDLETLPESRLEAAVIEAKMAMCEERGQDVRRIMEDAQAAVLDAMSGSISGAAPTSQKKAKGGGKKKKTRKNQRQQQPRAAQDKPSGVGTGSSSSTAGVEGKAAPLETGATEAMATEEGDAKDAVPGSETMQQQDPPTRTSAAADEAEDDEEEEEEDDDEERWCSICLAEVPQQADGMVAGDRLACGHAFHQQCMDMWSRWSTSKGQELSCPMCRAPVERGSIDKSA